MQEPWFLLRGFVRVLRLMHNDSAVEILFSSIWLAATFHFRISFWYGLLFPLGYTAGAPMAFDSVRRRLSGRVSWKGRMYS